MTNLLDRLGLQPQEKRVVVVVSTIVFLVLNYLFVWPRLGDYRSVLVKQEEAKTTRKIIEQHLKSLPGLTNRVQQLEKSGAGSLKHDQGSQFLSLIQNEASKASLNIMQTRNLPSFGGNLSTNDFVEDRVIMINFNAADSNLVDFLYAFSQPKSSLRVQSFDIGPEAPTQQRLSGSLTMVGSIDRPPTSKAQLKDSKNGVAASKNNPVAEKSDARKTAGSAGSEKAASKAPTNPKAGSPPPPKPGTTTLVKPGMAKTNSVSIPNKK